MPYKLLAALLAMLAVCAPACAQNTWIWSHRFELRADYRWSDDERHPIPFRLPAPLNQPLFLTTPEPGSHVELNTAELQFDVGYGELFKARAKAHAGGLHRRNPTSSDRKIDVDELWVRFGAAPEFLERPEGTSFFAQIGKAPRMERQPIRLLESYGLAANAFNRFEDVQAILGGSVGRNFYWRLQAANGNPLFFRDPNALAGDNGTPELRHSPPDPELGTGFPILYNAETEDLFFKSDHVQFGQAIGYRWASDDGSTGFDAIVFHYRRDLEDTENLTGTFYGGEFDLLNGPFDQGGLPTSGRLKREYGARVYAEWNELTAIAQLTKQSVAGLERDGWEVEVGYRFPLRFGWLESIQPAVRYSELANDFVGNGAIFPAPSVWWNWEKVDAGVRIGLKRNIDVTVEYTKHHVASRFALHLREWLATVRWRV